MVTSTVTAAPVANPLMNDRPMMNMPSSEMTTVAPANTTARPAVSMATTVARAGRSLGGYHGARHRMVSIRSASSRLARWPIPLATLVDEHGALDFGGAAG